jgi:hypothetical protein
LIPRTLNSAVQINIHGRIPLSTRIGIYHHFGDIGRLYFHIVAGTLFGYIKAEWTTIGCQGLLFSSCQNHLRYSLGAPAASINYGDADSQRDEEKAAK